MMVKRLDSGGNECDKVNIILDALEIKLWGSVGSTEIEGQEEKPGGV